MGVGFQVVTHSVCPSRWLFSPHLDAAVFLGVAVVSAAAALLVNAPSGEGDSVLLFVLCVVGIDVAHVWSTLFRTYFDGDEVKARPMLYLATPVALFVSSVVLHWLSAALFWTLLAYGAAWHFVRQQAGFAALYAWKNQASPWRRRVDVGMVYLVTVCPLVYWHAHLPRSFWWLKENDFVFQLPQVWGHWALGLEVAGVLLYGTLHISPLSLDPGAHVPKLMFLAATAISWSGIYWAQSDAAFTLTNVPLHGIAYFVLLFRYARARESEPGYRAAKVLLRAGLAGFVGFLVTLAFCEEWLWDALVWHDHAALFHDFHLRPSTAAFDWLVPLLALPQAVHYILDGFVWKLRANPLLKARLGF
jgi:hypothetical protein